MPPSLNPEQDAFNAVRRGIILALVGAEAQNIVGQVTGDGPFRFQIMPEWLANAISGLPGQVEQQIGRPLFEALVAAPAGVELSDSPAAQEGEAVQMVQRMLGFATALPFVTGELRNAVKALLGEHAPEALLKAIEDIPLDLGVNFFIGTVIERIFETAVSRPLEEAIAEQKRPARLEWPQIRALARAKALSHTEFVERLRKAGFRETDIPLITELDRQLLTVADLQAAYQFGLRDEPFIRDYLDKIGLSSDDADLAIDLYLKRAETAGGDQLRAVAQKGYLDSHISEDQYRTYLAMANVPQASIDLEVAAARLVKDWGRVQLNASEVKKLYEDGAINDAQVISRLQNLGYTEDDAITLVHEWTLTKAQGHPGLTEARILAYLVGGVITPANAYDRLVNLGIRSEDARFLVDHPEASTKIKSHPLSQSTIMAAMVDGIIDQVTAERMLVDQGMTADDAHLAALVTLHNANRGPKPKQPHKLLSEGQIIDAFKQGLARDTWAIRELVVAGYSEDDAMLLVAIEETKLSGVPPPDWTELV